MPERFEIDPVGPYALASSARFLEGFAPAAYKGDGRDGLRFAFVADDLAGGEAVAGSACVKKARRWSATSTGPLILRS